jgi:hypothetical protein
MYRWYTCKFRCVIFWVSQTVREWFVYSDGFLDALTLSLPIIGQVVKSFLENELTLKRCLVWVKWKKKKKNLIQVFSWFVLVSGKLGISMPVRSKLMIRIWIVTQKAYSQVLFIAKFEAGSLGHLHSPNYLGVHTLIIKPPPSVVKKKKLFILCLLYWTYLMYWLII